MNYDGEAENSDFVESSLEEIQSERKDEVVKETEYEEERERVEDGEEYLGTVEVRGESVQIEESMGIGTRARIMRQADELDGLREEEIDESEVLDLILSQIRALSNVTDKSESFFDRLDTEELRDTFQAVGEVSKEKEGN